MSNIPLTDIQKIDLMNAINMRLQQIIKEDNMVLKAQAIAVLSKSVKEYLTGTELTLTDNGKEK